MISGYLKSMLHSQIPFEKCTIIYTYYLTRAAKSPGETIAYPMSGIRPASIVRGVATKAFIHFSSPEPKAHKVSM